MPQKQPPATTALTLDGAALSGSSTAGSGSVGVAVVTGREAKTSSTSRAPPQSARVLIALECHRITKWIELINESTIYDLTCTGSSGTQCRRDDETTGD